MQVVCWLGLEELEPALRGFLRGRCRDDNEVDDLVQDTLLRAARYRPSLEDPSRLRGWTLSIAGNLVRERHRRRFRSGQVEVEEKTLEELACRDTGRDEPGEPLWNLGRGPALGQETVLAHLSKAIRGLQEHDRCLLRAYYGGDGGCAGAGAECGIAPGLVKVRLFRARRRLERAMRRTLDCISEAPQPS
jgi:RNA polymerase sigma factor (sigma-70 family)